MPIHTYVQTYIESILSSLIFFSGSQGYEGGWYFQGSLVFGNDQLVKESNFKNVFCHVMDAFALFL